jgi:hypothetical protein
MLSHCPDHRVGSDNTDITLLQPTCSMSKHWKVSQLLDLRSLLCNVQEAFAGELDPEDPVMFIVWELLTVGAGQDIAQHHNTQVAGHADRFKMLKLISQNYWWPQLSRHVGQYIGTCDPCNRTKALWRLPHRELHPTEIPEECWDTISVDFIIELPEVHRYDMVMVMVDVLSKRAHFNKCHTGLGAITAA